MPLLMLPWWLRAPDIKDSHKDSSHCSVVQLSKGMHQ
jgi:hypothetical protein